jgi:hypothetical protein
LRANIEDLIESHSRRRVRLWLLLAGLVLHVIFAVSCGGSNAKQHAEAPSGNESTKTEEQAGVDLEHPSLGDEDAPVILTEYADYQ